MIDASSISSSFLWAEADIMVPTQGAPSDDATLGQLILGIFVGKKIFHVLAVRSCTMSCEPRPDVGSCEMDGGDSDISKISLSDSKGVCSLGNSTLALVLLGSSRTLPAVLLLSISCVEITVKAFGSRKGSGGCVASLLR